MLNIPPFSIVQLDIRAQYSALFTFSYHTLAHSKTKSEYCFHKRSRIPQAFPRLISHKNGEKETKQKKTKEGKKGVDFFHSPFFP